MPDPALPDAPATPGVDGPRVPQTLRELLATLAWLAALMVGPYLVAFVLAALIFAAGAGFAGLRGADLAEAVKTQISPPALGFWISGLFASALMILSAQALAARRFGVAWRGAVGLVRMHVAPQLMGLLVLLFIGYFIWAALIVALLKAFWPAQVVMPEITSAVAGAGATAPIAFVFLAVLTPIAEELIFRGYAFARLRTIFAPGAVIGLTALLFAFAHFNGGVLHPLVTLYLGVATGWLRHMRASLVPGMLLHGLVNGLAVSAMLAR